MLIRRNRQIQGRGVEVGPERIGEIEFAVSKLPQEKVADALLSAGANEQVRFGCVRHGEATGQLLFSECAALFRQRLDQALHGLQQIPAAAVIGGDGKRHAGIVAGQLFGARNQFGDFLAERGEVADYSQAYTVAVQLFRFPLQRQHEQLLQHRHFLGRSAPVLRTEREQGEVLDAPRRAGFDHFAHDLHAAFVTGRAR